MSQQPEVHRQRPVQIAIGAAFGIRDDDFPLAVPQNADLRHIAAVWAFVEEIAGDDEFFPSP
jgi:hypothetical protein